MEHNHFKNIDLKAIESHDKVIDIFVQAFKESNNNKQACADLLLQQLFWLLSFDFKLFLESLHLTPTETIRYISYLLYAIYYREIPLAALAAFGNTEHIEYFLLCMTAESLKQKKMKSILQRLPLNKQLRLGSYCALYVREGTWMIFNLLAHLRHQDLSWNLLFKHLRNKYYDAAYLNSFLSSFNLQSTPTLKSIVEALEKHADSQIVEIVKLLPKLIDTMILFIKNERKILIEKLFCKFSLQNYSFDELKDFFLIFGLKGHVLNDSTINNPTGSASLVNLLQALLNLFQMTPQVMTPDKQQQILFILDLCRHLYAFHRESPQPYAKGLKHLVFALPTRGIDLPEQPWLTSVLEGLKAIETYLKKRNPSKSTIQMPPIVIFDQSLAKEFKKNDKYIKAAAQEYGIGILHFSKLETFKLAQKLGIKSWIRTSRSSYFGYGGARNCAFLLAPVIAAAYRKGKCTVQEILMLQTKELSALYNKAVLGKQGQDFSIHMGEDDVAIPPSNLFSDVLFSATWQKLYFTRSMECSGRTTQSVYPFLDLKSILEAPSTCFFTSTNTLFRGAMKGMLSKPRFCLPIPIGNEELHVIPSHESFFHFHQANIHLAGTRFPNNEIPQSPLDGILTVLKEQLPYRFHITLSAILTDSQNQFSRRIYPWNDLVVRAFGKIQTLNDLWNFASSFDVIQELKQRFWGNVEALFDDKNSEIILRKCLKALIEVNLSVEAPAELKQFYETMQEEAYFFEEFARALLFHRASGSLHFIQLAKVDVESQFKKKVITSVLTKGFLALIEAIENFGQVPLILKNFSC